MLGGSDGGLCLVSSKWLNASTAKTGHRLRRRMEMVTGEKRRKKIGYQPTWRTVWQVPVAGSWNT